eukprot:TRINITY_DN66469_c9_g7_i2.p1 TRINITY_DN66469_c9_g7~~TRINITY_DN66469_c9_g7_i2.p1  ORF type:complete len:874 (+),score=399.67 TRINITY_DN66469_c9_g7_i2:537-3158(+)
MRTRRCRSSRAARAAFRRRCARRRTQVAMARRKTMAKSIRAKRASTAARTVATSTAIRRTTSMAAMSTATRTRSKLRRWRMASRVRIRTAAWRSSKAIRATRRRMLPSTLSSISRVSLTRSITAVATSATASARSRRMTLRSSTHASSRITARSNNNNNNNNNNNRNSLVDAAGLVARNRVVAGNSTRLAVPVPRRTVAEIADAIAEGANSFLRTEYTYISAFIVAFSLLIVVLLGQLGDDGAGGLSSWRRAVYTSIAFVLGSVTSLVCGFVGMRIAVFANSRTAVQARHGFGPAFATAFRAGAVMGFFLVSLGLLVLFLTIVAFRRVFVTAFHTQQQTNALFEAVAGYGLGGSSIALFGRVGGGIFTKAADVGADLSGKVDNSIPEDDPRNPAVIADNVGDNVGDIAGMGSDLFGSFAEASCAAMVIASESTTPLMFQSWHAMVFPLLVSACGILVSVLTSFVATHLKPVRSGNDVEPTLKNQLSISTVANTPVMAVLAVVFLPPRFTIGTDCVHNYGVFFCVMIGMYSGLIIGHVTEYFTSYAYKPVREVAGACKTGTATNVIYGLALGYESTVVPVACLVVTIYVSHSLAGMYGIALAALGMLSNLCTALTIDAYGPICDNAGGIAEMAQLGTEVRAVTDKLDAAGNTTAAIGKGFAIGSAALVGLALFGAFVTSAGITDINILDPAQFGGLLWGAMLPYWFSAMTMKSVGKAALTMVLEVRRQFASNPGILRGTQRPDYARCVKISTDASLREMVRPSCLVIFTPIVFGLLFGSRALSGVLAGALVSGVQMAVSASNTGGAFDNAKKYIELGHHGGKGSDVHKSAVTSDSIGDPLKDTSGPALNILIKLMAIISLVFARAFSSDGWIGL